MVDGVNIHFEGDKGLRPGFQKLLAKYISLCRQRGIKFRLVPGGSREETIKDFLRSCRNRQSHLNVLLIDSEGPISDTTNFIGSLRDARFWDRAVHCEDAQINFMVQAMEAWFVADRRALVSHFGGRFNVKALPSPQSAESIAPANLVDAIQRGLPRRGRRRRSYDKVVDGAALLGLIDHAAVSRHCPQFRRLMDFLDRQF